MKTCSIELQRAHARHNRRGTIEARIAAGLESLAARPDDDKAGKPLSLLRMRQETARVLMLLIDLQLAEFDKREARSRF